MSDTEIPIMRVPISLPCQVRVLPGTPVADGPIEDRTEFCAVDAWWMVGTGLICTRHLREWLRDGFDETVGDVQLNASELRPWAEQHRYDQATVHPAGSRVAAAGETTP